MDKLVKILLSINENNAITQRDIAKSANISLGTANILIKDLINQGYLAKNEKQYHLTAKGNKYLEQNLAEYRTLRIKQKAKKINNAVILAAGYNRDLKKPACLVEVDSRPIIDRSLEQLRLAGVENIFVVVGYDKELVEEHLKDANVTIIDNEKFKQTGTMFSLDLTFNDINDDFLLVEGDLVFEYPIIDYLANSSYANEIIITSISGSGDEAYVDYNDDFYLEEISKDIRQMMRTSTEMIGISKISIDLFKKMHEIFNNSDNPWINYEYMMSKAAKTFDVHCQVFNNTSWVDVDNKTRLDQLIKKTIFDIKRHDNEYKKQYVLDNIVESLQVKPEDIENISFSGGMTNNNYQFRMKGKNYFIRIPGAFTDEMIDRNSESLNTRLASILKINPDTIYINALTGIKITDSVDGAVTMSSKSIAFPQEMSQAVNLIKELHNADFAFSNEFNIIDELNKYEKLMHEANAQFFDDYEEKRNQFVEMYNQYINEYKPRATPSHNDLVAENFIEDKNGKMFLIDWEYAGMNNEYWDLAALANENEFSHEQIESELHQYFDRKVTEDDFYGLNVMKVAQDILWAVWTLLKEAGGESFGSYGLDRWNRGTELMKEIKHA